MGAPLDIESLLSKIDLPLLHPILRQFPGFGVESERRKLIRRGKARKDAALIAAMERVRAHAFDIQRLLHTENDIDVYAVVSGLMEAAEEVLPPTAAEFSDIGRCEALLKGLYRNVGQWSPTWIAGLLDADSFGMFNDVSNVHHWTCRHILAVDFYTSSPAYVEIALGGGVTENSAAIDAQFIGRLDRLQTSLLADGWVCDVVRPNRQFSHPIYPCQITLSIETDPTLAFATVTRLVSQ